MVQVSRLGPYILETLPKSKFFLSYDFFHWVKILPVAQMEIIWALLAIATFFVTIGLFYRVSIIYIFFAWTYVLLLCNGHYNNHYYLLSLIAFIMIFTGADRWGSLKNWIFAQFQYPWKKEEKESSWLQKLSDKWQEKKKSIPNWQIWLLKIQIVIVYFYGAIAKIDADWLAGYPLKFWLKNKTMPFFTEFLQSDNAPYLFSYGGLIFDFSIGFLLFYKRTRWLAIFALIIFHIPNHYIWNIGVFPWFMLFAAAIYFPPDWPEKFLQKIRGLKYPPISTPRNSTKTAQQKWVSIGIGLYLFIQLFLPLRHYFYPGKTSWTGQGDNFAWHMMLFDRAYVSKMRVDLPGQGTLGFVKFEDYINLRQYRKMGHNPRNFIRFAQFLRDEMKANGLKEDPEIYAFVWRQLNGRPYQLVMDSTLNLATYEYDALKVPDCVMPFKNLPYKEDAQVITEDEVRLIGL